MKNLFFAVCFIFNFLTVFSQNSNDDEYVVFLKDKNNSPYSISNPSEFLTTKSIERRQRYSIGFDISDLPVNPSYIEQIKSMGGNVKYASKWLNGVVIIGGDNLNAINSLPFVKEIRRIRDSRVYDKNPGLNNKFLVLDNNNSTYRTIHEKSSMGYDYGASYNQIAMLSGEALHNSGFRGEGMTIAVLDAGFLHVDTMAIFDSLRVNNQILGTKDFVLPGANVYGQDMSPHGMMVLSVMGGILPGKLIGTAPKANYWLLHSEDYYAEYVGEEYNWVAAAEFADSVGVDIINSSLSYTTFDDTMQNHTYSQMDGNTTIITKGADMAAKKGILVVCSAGNYGNTLWKYIGAPADGDSVFTIGAVEPDSVYASFSSTGPSFDKRIKPNVVAQGYGAVTAGLNGGISYQSGTSFSSPIIAGMCACLWQSKINHNNMEIIQAIESSANQFSNPDSLLGYGIPNFMHASNLLGGINPIIKNQNDINVFPNPFTDNLTVTFSLKTIKVNQIQILDVTGANVFNLKNYILVDNILYIKDISQLPKGLYILKIISPDKTFTKKIVKA